MACTIWHSSTISVKTYLVLAIGFVWGNPWQRGNPRKASCMGSQGPSESSKVSIYYHFYICRKAKVMLERRTLCFVPSCWFVCQSDILRENLVQETIWGMYRLTLCMHDFLSISNGKWTNVISWNFQDRSNMRQGPILNILGICI